MQRRQYGHKLPLKQNESNCSSGGTRILDKLNTNERVIDFKDNTSQSKSESKEASSQSLEPKEAEQESQISAYTRESSTSSSSSEVRGTNDVLQSDTYTAICATIGRILCGRSEMLPFIPQNVGRRMHSIQAALSDGVRKFVKDARVYALDFSSLASDSMPYFVNLVACNPGNEGRAMNLCYRNHGVSLQQMLMAMLGVAIFNAMSHELAPDRNLPNSDTIGKVLGLLGPGQ